MASGKSTVGRLVAAELGLPVIDNDELLERRTTMTAAEIAERWGVARLHRRELAVLRLALRAAERSVVTAAASVADRPDVLRRLLSPHDVVLLHAAPAVLASRAEAAAGEHRRLAGDALLAALRAQAATRLPVYRAVASIEVDVGELEPGDAARLIAASV